MKLNRRGVISLLSVDEVHSVVLDRSFRADLQKLKENFFRPLLRKRSYLRVLAMTGTTTKGLLTEIKNVLTIDFQVVMWGEMSRRNIFIDVIIPPYEQYMEVMKDRILVHLKRNMKTIVFTNIREKAIKKIVPFCDSVVAEMVLGDNSNRDLSFDTLRLDVNDMGNDSYLSDLNVNVATLHGET